MSNDQKKQIIDYFFSRPGLPKDLRRTFEKWMLSMDGESDTDDILEAMWDSHEGYASEEENRKGLQRLHAGIRRSRMRIMGRRVIRGASIAAAVIILFAGGFYTASLLREGRTEMVTLLTARESVGEFELPDGTVVWLNGESSLRYPSDFSDDLREVVLSGEAFFEVEKDPARPFVVNMQDIRVEVLGTSFDAISYDFSTYESIILKTGSVKVSGEGLPQPLIISPDEKLTFDREGGNYLVEKVDAQNYCRWFSPHMIFDNTPLRDILTNLERRYSIEIVVSPGIPLDKRLSMVIYREPLSEIMEVMESLIPIKYEIGEHTLAIKEK